VWSALEGLDETYREPLVLFYREGQSVAAVADALGISGDAAKQRLARGREQVREKVAQRIEAALRRSRPGTAFTMAVLAALPAVIAGSAKAATAGGAAAVAKAAVATGASGALIGIAGGLAGAGLGAWAT